MKKKAFITVALVILVLLGAVALSACDPENPHKGVQTIPIATAEQLLALKDCLGSAYDQTTYELQNDIDLSGTDWIPLGTDGKNAFCSDFDGKGYKITGVRIHTEAVSEVQESSSAIGFFGFTRDAAIRNLELTIDYDFVFDTEITYAGGLVGYAYGDTVLSGITVNGELSSYVISEADNLQFYVGGVLGSSTGSLKMENVVNNASIFADKLIGDGPLGTRLEVNRLHTAYAGGVGGYIRTVDLSATNKQDNLIDNVVNNGDITVYAERLNAGGVIGSLYNASEATELAASSQSAMLFDSALRANVGGVLGYIDNANLSDAVCEAVVLELARKNVKLEPNKIFNVGGLVGYAANYSVIRNSRVATVVMLDANTDFGGGLAGVLCDSEIKDCSATGKFINKYQNSGAMYDVLGQRVKFENGEYVSGTVVSITYPETLPKWSGGVSKLFGKANISKLEIDFQSFQAVLSTKVDRVKAEKEGDKQVFKTYASVIDKETIRFEASKVIQWTKDPASAALYGTPVGIPEGNDGGTGE